MITLPTYEEFAQFWGDGAPTDIDQDRAELFIQLSSDLLWLATKIDDDPADSRLAQLVKYAICDMAAYLYVSRDSLDEAYSPFNSERIGSYSYSKTYTRLNKAIAFNEPTGVPFFDRVVAELLDEDAYGDSMIVGGQQIFPDQYIPLQYEVYGPYGNPNQDAGRPFPNWS